MTTLPTGFSAFVSNFGIKDDHDDFVVLTAGHPTSAAGVFTKSRFAGPSVVLSREHLRSGQASTIVIISKNANVANGPRGTADAAEVCELVAERLGQRVGEIVIASTGVIGRPYPMERIRLGVASMPATLGEIDAERLAQGIMTTDTVPKVASEPIVGTTASVVGIAKGVGMIEPNMATMIAVLCTDAEIDSASLDAVFRTVVDRTFNCVSIDTDTSTSDSAVILASGAAGPVDLAALEVALDSVCTQLTKMIAADGEGAETLIEVIVDGARDGAQAKLVAKSIVNSPLVKTAVHGADPNWGRIAMAIGKCESETDIDQDRVTIRFGTTEVYPHQLDEVGLEALSNYLRSDEVRIHVSLDTGHAAATVWGCDLTDGYIRINADYTT